MIIHENTIEFKSSFNFYTKEKSGLKNNTGRIMNENEQKEFLNYIRSITHIQITLEDQSDYFIRKITDISIFQKNNIFMVIFTWSNNER